MLKKTQHNPEAQKGSWLNKRYYTAAHQNSSDSKKKNPNHKDTQELGATCSDETALTEWDLFQFFSLKMLAACPLASDHISSLSPGQQKQGGASFSHPTASSLVTPKSPSHLLLPKWRYDSPQLLVSCSQIRAPAGVFGASQNPQTLR